jgi:CheY-like chemotaxis protein
MLQLLLVEDEDPKRRHIASFVKEVMPNAELKTARSVRAALDSLDERVPDLLILDMSLPTFDVGENESGGRPQGFGGLELMRNMELEEIACPVVVLTGYDAFTKAGGQVGLNALNAELTAAHPLIFKGLIHFNSAYGDWSKNFENCALNWG